jgi:type IV secretory pathway VirB10-like protein
MSETTESGPSSAARFAERYGINRRRSAIAAALVGSVLVVALFVMNQRIQARRTMAAEASDSTALAPPVEPVEPSAERAAWADPQEARRLAGDTLPAVPQPEDTLPGGEYVPLGRDVGPGGYADASRGEAPGAGTSVPDPASGYSGAGPTGAYPAEERPPSPEEMRRTAFQRAVSSRQLRARRADGDGRTAADSLQVPSPVLGNNGIAAGAAQDAATELRPYGPEQAEEDRRAAERAGQELARPRPQAAQSVEQGTFARFAFASSPSRPCREGERVLSAGYVITATLASSINSEAPGPVLARIGRDVYDAGLRCVIFPAGSLLVGRYPEGLEAGEQRLVVVWEQVVLGDGRTWTLPSLPAADRQGAVGVAGRVDRRTRETFEAAALLSAFGAVIAYATPGGGQTQAPLPGGYPQAPSARDRAVGAATEPFRGAAERLLDRAAGIRPVLRLDVGAPITVIVPRSIDLDRPAPAPTDTVPVAPRPTTTQS